MPLRSRRRPRDAKHVGPWALAIDFVPHRGTDGVIPLLKRMAMRMLTDELAIRRVRARLPHPHAVVLMYHEVAPDELDIEAWTVVRLNDLKRQLAYVASHYDVVSMDEAGQRLAGGVASGRPCAVLTFDDGHKGNLEVLLPLIESLGLPVTIYIASGHIESQRLYWFDRIVNALQTRAPIDLDLTRFRGLRRYHLNNARGARNWVHYQQLLQDVKSLDPTACETVADEIAVELSGVGRDGGRLRPLAAADVTELARSRLVEIGGHTHCHTLQPLLSRTDRLASLERNRTLLERWTGRAVNHFAYPSGAHDEQVTRDVRDSGYRTAVTTAEGIWSAAADPFLIPRFGVGRYDGAAEFKMGLLGGRHSLVSHLLAGRVRSERLST